jgi:predicted nucleotide-binding protein
MWPKYLGISKLLYDQGLNPRTLIETMPPGLMLPDPQNSRFVWVPRDGDELRVTLTGLQYCKDTEDDLSLLARVARYFADREHAFALDSLSAPQELIITSDEIEVALGLTSEELARAYGLISTFDVGTAGCSGNVGQWSCKIDFESVRRYRTVENVQDYLRAQPAPRAPATMSRQVLASKQVRPRTNLPHGEEPEPDPRAVFVVHGRDSEVQAAMWSFLEVIGLHPLEWNELVCSTGRVTPFTGEVLETAFAKAQAVVVLMTPDDEARLHAALQNEDDLAYERELTCQPRPNVLYEAGMAFGAHPNRTIIVEVGRLRPISDLAGRNVVRLSTTKAPLKALADRLEAAGCPVDRSNDEWLDTSRFAEVAAIRRHSAPPASQSGTHLKAGTILPRTTPKAAPPLLAAQLYSRGRDGYLLEVVNRGGVVLRNIEWQIPEDVPNWHFLTSVLPEYPLECLDPREHVRVPAVISMGGPVYIDLVMKATTEDGTPYETTNRLSVYG